MKISTQFAIDRNRDKKISKEEHVAFKELKTRDADDSGSLEGRELTDVFIQYGEDVWLEGGRRHRISGDGFTQIVELRKVGFEPPRIDMKVDIQM